MLKWMKRHRSTDDLPRRQDAQPRPVTSGKYPFLYQYLQDRYADTVVLTFDQIESLLGCALPDQARLNQQWWTNGDGTATGAQYSDCWISARRVATPNLPGQTVSFDRAS